MWQIKLEGDESFLAAMASCYSEAALSVQKFDEEYWLRSCLLQGAASNREAYCKGEELISYINCSSRLYGRRIKAVKSNGYYLTAQNGMPEYKFHGLSLNNSIPLRLTTISDDLPAEDYLSFFLEEERAKYVLEEFNRDNHNWYSLFNIYEAVLSDPEVLRKYGTAKNALASWECIKGNQLFFSAAGWHRHSKYGRLGGRSSRPPKKLMQLVEGEEFVRELIIAWLNHKVKWA